MNAIYEDAKVLAEYLLFHYGRHEEILTGDSWPAGMREALDFAVRTPGYFSRAATKRGLDIGCAVGRSTFEMAEFCEEVIGVDYSHAFIKTAKKLQSGQEVSYHRRDEGNLSTCLVAKAPDVRFPDGIGFLQGDAMDLPESLGRFDAVHAANVLCRLREPLRLLRRLPALVNPGGELVLATPCTWLEEFTPSVNWPEGDTLSWLESALDKSFRLEKVAEEPFLIRETARKFQWSKSLVSLWKRC